MKGKHGARAAAKRENHAQEALVAEYERTCQNQQTEIAQLTEQVERWKRAHAEDTRALRAMLQTQTSKSVADLTEQLKKSKHQVEQSQLEYKSLHGKWSSALTRLVDWIKQEKGVTGTEATEFAMYLIGGITEFVAVDKKGGDGTLEIQRARGKRTRLASGGTL